MWPDVLHIEIEHEMTWIACIKRLEVSGMIWLLVKNDVNVLHGEIELEMTWVAYTKMLKESRMTWLLVKDNMDVLYIEIENIVRINFTRDIDTTYIGH
jgi:hypothetical protein